METDLDVAYEALKRLEGDPSSVAMDVGTAGREAANALAQSFVVNIWARAKGNRDEYSRLYKDLAPKAMVMITCVVGVVRDMAQGNTSSELDAFLNGVMKRGQA